MNPRYQALQQIRLRETPSPKRTPIRPSEEYGVNVFSRRVMKQYLSHEVYEALKKTIDERSILERSIAAPVANGIKAWALDQGVTHYTHWFQPLTGRTAEKHESFLELVEGEVIEKFSGDELSQQEPDASAFPTGGLRRTFEARGFTAWDCSSPIFILDNKYGKTLYIPTIFVSYTGEALDYKIPLLRSIAILDQAATAVCKLFQPEVNRVYPSLGMEQEFFLVDEALFELRSDLVLTGRTVIGAMPGKGNHILDHYASSIPDRIVAFFNELEHKCFKLGIPLKTRHNEVAPGQFEVVPQFEPINIAIDHGQLLIDLIDRTARQHDLRALMHEKPFAGVNGSGKHNNWSLHTDTGINLLAPGKDPIGNLMFLSFFVCLLKAIAAHADLLRASIASAGNALRLGQDEAPPSIFSVFVGQSLTKVLQDIEHPPRRRRNEEVSTLIHLGISEIPEILVGNTDSNRTAPFAFTGNKVEFRAVGSATNSSYAMTILQIALARYLQYFHRRVNSKMNRGRDKEAAILDMVKEYYVESKHILFEGDSYSEEWQEEALRRKLFNPSHTVEALDRFLTQESLALFIESGLFTESEVKARHQVLIGKYLNQMRAEASIFLELIQTQVIPTAVRYQKELLENLHLAERAGFKNESSAAPRALAGRVGKELNRLLPLSEKLKEFVKEAERKKGTHRIARAYAEQVFPLFEPIRTRVDQLEQWIPDEMWPLPKYRELWLCR
jgi:glutamine synthetase